MLSATVKKVDFEFITPGRTSRGILYKKPSWFIQLNDKTNIGVGECSVIPNLNPEYDEGYEQKIVDTINRINSDETIDLDELDHYPSIRFGLETAFLDLKNHKQGILFPSAFTEGLKGIPINGLIWMGSRREMQNRIATKLREGFKVLKLKVGALDFKEELDMVRDIRKVFSSADLELRLDANGAFPIDEAEEKLKWLSDFYIHSIEQPIKQGSWDAMASLCRLSQIPIALDEELIGVVDRATKQELLSTIEPQYIILKPSLIGGLQKSIEWIELADGQNIGWWATSALESNVGLNAIAQWVFTLNPKLVQGLGTGMVFSNNIPSPLELKGSELFYNIGSKWGEVGLLY